MQRSATGQVDRAVHPLLRSRRSSSNFCRGVAGWSEPIAPASTAFHELATIPRIPPDCECSHTSSRSPELFTASNLQLTARSTYLPWSLFMLPHSLLTTMGVFLAFVSPICFAGDADISGVQILQQAEQAARDRGQTNGYTEIRGYALRNERFKLEAQMEVRAVHPDLGGVNFAVLRVNGSEDIQRRIFKQILEGEAKLSRLPAAEVALSNENYTVELSGTELYNGRRCYVLRMRPRRKCQYLLDGRAWIDVATHALVKMEGRPTASLSIWVGKPLIIREFEQLGRIWVPARSRSVASTLILGTTELTIMHRDQQLYSR